MSETTNNSMEESLQKEYETLENKLILLYLIDKMDIPLSNSQIQQFALEDNHMTFFVLQQSLNEMVQVGYLEKFQNNNTTRYTITEDGLNVLEYFEKQIPYTIRSKISKYISENRKIVKKEYEISANYFYENNNNEYIVKCSVYEDEALLMEINVSVVSREQAKLICSNWKENVKNLYENILSELVNIPKK